MTKGEIEEYIKQLDSDIFDLYMAVESVYLQVLHDTQSDEFQIVAKMRDVFKDHVEERNTLRGE